MKKLALILITLVTAACATLPISKEKFNVHVLVVEKEHMSPLQGATVSCNGRVMITGADGKAFFNDVPAGQFRLYARKTGYWDGGFSQYRNTEQIIRITLTRREHQ